MAENSGVLRFDVLDGSFRVLLRGTSPNDIVPLDVPVALETRLATELSVTLEHHDFRRRPVATGLFGEEFSWRVAQIGGPNYYALLLDRGGLGKRVKNFSRRRRLSDSDARLLRAIVGGYEPHEVARRVGIAPSAVRASRAELALRLGYADAKQLVLDIAGGDESVGAQFEQFCERTGSGIAGRFASGT